jgi:hypothetical protein
MSRLPGHLTVEGNARIEQNTPVREAAIREGNLNYIADLRISPSHRVVPNARRAAAMYPPAFLFLGLMPLITLAELPRCR